MRVGKGWVMQERGVVDVLDRTIAAAEIRIHTFKLQDVRSGLAIEEVVISHSKSRVNY